MGQTLGWDLNHCIVFRDGYGDFHGSAELDIRNHKTR